MELLTREKFSGPGHHIDADAVTLHLGSVVDDEDMLGLQLLIVHHHTSGGECSGLVFQVSLVEEIHMTPSKNTESKLAL